MHFMPFSKFQLPNYADNVGMQFQPPIRHACALSHLLCTNHFFSDHQLCLSYCSSPNLMAVGVGAEKFHCSGVFSCIQCSLHIQEPNKFSTCSVPTHRTHLFRILNSLGRHLHVILGVISQSYHRGPLPNALEIATP